MDLIGLKQQADHTSSSPSSTKEEHGDSSNVRSDSMGASHSSPRPVPLLIEGGGDVEKQLNASSPAKRRGEPRRKLALLPLIFLIFFEVAGGPFGEEASVGAAGPLLAILGFVIFPFIWSVPEALITAELATTFPGNGGFVIWAHKAFGPFWGSMMGTWKLLSGMINLSSYPVLCTDYLKVVFPIFTSGYPRYAGIFGFTLFFSFLNYLGLSIVGYFAVFLGLISLSPFLVMAGLSIPKIQPARWVDMGTENRNWTLFFNTLFWNLNFWDNASTLAGEVENPQKTFPIALLSAGFLTILGYLIPLLSIIGAIPLEQSKWVDGYFASAAATIGGTWLKYYVEVSSVLSVIGLYEAQLTSCAYQFHGMAEIGVLPKFFGVRSKWFNTPWVGILIPTVLTLFTSCLNFIEIISSVNFLYSLGMLLEIAAFIWLRKILADVYRPYKVPFGFYGLIVMCFLPTVFLVYVMTIGTLVVYILSGSFTVIGVLWYFLMKICRKRKWLKFNNLEGEHEDGDEEDGDDEKD